MEQQSLTIDTKVGIIGGSLTTVFANIHIADLERTVVLGAIGTLVSFVVSLICKGMWQILKKHMCRSFIGNPHYSKIQQLKLKIKMKTKASEMNLVERASAPTPKFFKILRTIGLVLAAAGGTMLASPIALPVAITSVAAYLTVAAGVLTAVSQVAVDEEAL